MNKTIGVAIATFNGVRYIEEQLNSICSQTVKPNLISISDDGSTDGTVAALEVFRRRSKIPVVLNTNTKRVGVVENFMRAFNQCDTDYISYSDQDDVWHPNKVASYSEI